MAATKEPSIPITQKLVEWLIERGYEHDNRPSTDNVLRRMVGVALMRGELDSEKLLELCGLKEFESEEEMETETKTGESKADKMFGKAAGAGNVRVKLASERYSDKRWSAVHAKTGRPVFDEFGSEVSRPSQKTLALNGAYLKFAGRKAGMQVDWTEHDQQLLDEAINHYEWNAHDGDPNFTKTYAPGAIKAPLLDDSISGGVVASPQVFDADFIHTPLLTGELLPTVNLVPVSRGRRVETGSIGVPTAQWGEGDAGAGTIFDSTSQIAAIDTSIYDLSSHVLVGRNFLSDSALQIGTLLMPLIGERMGNQIELVIATGSGSQPTGVMSASGTTSVAFSSAAATVAKYLTLLFSVPKAERANGTCVFCANETTYQRARAIATGVSGDTRLVFEMDVENFSVLGRPFKIAPSMANTQIFFGNMSKYRLYRRLGSLVSWTIEGSTLQRANEALLSVRQRWGGRVLMPTSFGVATDAQS